MPSRPAIAPAITIRPLSPERWPDVERLFGERGACGGCWCMFWRLRASQFQKQKGSANRRAFKRIVSSGESPGLLAYRAGQPVGWCAVGPRVQYIRMENSRVLGRVDDTPVWSVSCLFVDRKYRRQGISVKLLTAAVAFARKHKALILEGYPTDPAHAKAPDAFVWTGLASAYRQAGFVEVIRRSKTRPIMRFDLRRKTVGRTSSKDRDVPTRRRGGVK